MSPSLERLWELLPAIHRIRDAERGGPLRALLTVIAEQVDVLEADLRQLYDDQFIETCADWVVPYLGDLVGCRQLHGVTPAVASPRAEVANTIAYRRRKGTAAMLEQLARDVTGWPARVVEFFALLGWTQHVNHVRPGHWQAPDLRRWEDLERLGTPFERSAHTAEVRHVATGRGRYNIPSIGILVWRLRHDSLTRSPVVPVDDRRFLLSPLGAPVALVTRPRTEPEITHLATPLVVPAPISRLVLHHRLEDYYGEGKSLVLYVDGIPLEMAAVAACNLADAGGGAWAHAPVDRVGIDPELGRVAFPLGQPAPRQVRATFHHAFSAGIGGGEYERAPVSGAAALHVAMPQRLQDALAASAAGGVVEVTDSGRYEEMLSITLGTGASLDVRAQNGRRPTVVLGSDLVIVGGAESVLTLDGLVLAGATLRVPATADQGLRRLRLRHCTLVPGLALDRRGEPLAPGTPSLVVERPGVTVEIDHSIVGALRVDAGSVVRIANSLVDATDEGLTAYAAPGAGAGAGGSLRLENATVIGRVHALSLGLVSNSILAAAASPGVDPVRAERRQVGCVRFSYVPPGSRTPRRHRCQPDLAVQGALEAALQADPVLDEPALLALAARVQARVAPAFTDRRYGRPAYGQLAWSCAAAIRSGADDESEMGAFHDLYQPQRETNLRVRLDEYLRAGLEAGILHVT